MVPEIPSSLLAEARAEVIADREVFARATEVSVEAAGNLLGSRAEPGAENLGGVAPAWGKLKHEVYLLVCTDHPAYEDVRKQVRAADKTAKTMIIPAIAVAVGGIVGIAAGVLTPFIGLAMLSIVHVGKNAWCKSCSQANPSFGSESGKPLVLSELKDDQRKP